MSTLFPIPYSNFHNRAYVSFLLKGPPLVERRHSRHLEPKENTMKKKEIVPNEKECISQCIIKFWSGSSQPVENRDERYEQCLTNCDVCGSA